MDQLKLVEVAASESCWQEAAQDVLSEQGQLTDMVAHAADGLIDGVVWGTVSLDDLRAGVRWANALDAEAVQLYGSDVTVGEQQLERTARRIMHQAGRTALAALKNEPRRSVTTMNRRLEARRMVG